VPPLRKVSILTARGAAVLLFLGAVEISVRAGLINALFVPPPSMVMVGLVEELGGGELARGILATLYELTWACILATVIGVTLGYTFWRYRILGEAFDPLLSGLFGSPIILLYPIFLVIFGRTSEAVIAQGFVLGVIPIILYTKRGFAEVERVLLDVGRVFRLRWIRVLRQIVLPAAAPAVFTGLRLGFTYILISVIAMEYVAQVGGLGNIIAQSYFTFNINMAYVGVAGVVILSVLFIYLTYRAEKMVRR